MGEPQEPSLPHFLSIPWCGALLTDPKWKITPTLSRQRKSSTEDSLIAETLSTERTIPHMLTLYRLPASPSDHLGALEPPNLSPSPLSSPSKSSAPFVQEIITLLSLGSGLNGAPHILHGGLISTLLDDVMGTLLTINKDQGGMPLTQSTVTASLNVRYLAPVRTPGTVAVRVCCERREGRKFWLVGEVLKSWGGVDGEKREGQGMGKVLARGEAVWVTRKEKGEKEKGKL